MHRMQTPGGRLSARYKDNAMFTDLVRQLDAGTDIIVSVKRNVTDTGSMGHAVIVEAIDPVRRMVRIRDPGPGVYEVDIPRFVAHWTRRAVFIR
jgi:hypothetical protein